MAELADFVDGSTAIRLGPVIQKAVVTLQDGNNLGVGQFASNRGDTTADQQIAKYHDLRTDLIAQPSYQTFDLIAVRTILAAQHRQR